MDKEEKRFPPEAKRDAALSTERKADDTLGCIRDAYMQPREHQARIAKKLLTQRGVIAAHEMGLGKSFTMILSAVCVIANLNLDVVIVAPLSVLPEFEKAKKMYGEKGAPFWKRITIITFDNLYRNYKPEFFKDKALFIDEAHREKGNVNKVTKFDSDGYVIFDEKTTEGKRAQHALASARMAKKVLAASGTVVLNRAAEFLPLLNMVRDKPLTITANNFDFLVNEQPETLLREIQCWVSYVTVPFDSDDWPKVNRYETRVPMDEKYYQAYMGIEQRQFEGLSDDQKKLYSDSKNLHAFYNGVRRAINDLGGTEGPKVKLVIEQLKKGLKTLIFSNFKDAGVRLVRKAIEESKQNISYATFTGDETKEERAEIVKKWNARPWIATENYLKGEYAINPDVKDPSTQQPMIFSSRSNENKNRPLPTRYNSDNAFWRPVGPRLMVIILSVGAGGVGVSFNEVRLILKLDGFWNPAEEEQVDRRGVRFRSHSNLPPSERVVDIYSFILEKPEISKRTVADLKRRLPSIDGIMSETVKRKRQDLQIVVDNILIPASIEENVACQAGGEGPIKTATTLGKIPKPRQRRRPKTEEEKKQATLNPPLRQREPSRSRVPTEFIDDNEDDEEEDQKRTSSASSSSSSSSSTSASASMPPPPRSSRISTLSGRELTRDFNLYYSNDGGSSWTEYKCGTKEVISIPLGAPARHVMDNWSAMDTACIGGDTIQQAYWIGTVGIYKDAYYAPKFGPGETVVTIFNLRDRVSISELEYAVQTPLNLYLKGTSGWQDINSNLFATSIMALLRQYQGALKYAVYDRRGATLTFYNSRAGVYETPYPIAFRPTAADVARLELIAPPPPSGGRGGGGGGGGEGGGGGMVPPPLVLPTFYAYLTKDPTTRVTEAGNKSVTKFITWFLSSVIPALYNKTKPSEILSYIRKPTAEEQSLWVSIGGNASQFYNTIVSTGLPITNTQAVDKFYSLILSDTEFSKQIQTNPNILLAKEIDAVAKVQWGIRVMNELVASGVWIWQFRLIYRNL